MFFQSSMKHVSHTKKCDPLWLATSFNTCPCQNHCLQISMCGTYSPMVLVGAAGGNHLTIASETCWHDIPPFRQLSLRLPKINNIWLWIAIVLQTTDGVEHCLGINCNSVQHNVVVLNGPVLLHRIVIHRAASSRFNVFKYESAWKKIL